MQRAFKKQIKLIVALTAACSMPALADTGNVSVYGRLDMSYDFIKTGTSAAGVGGASKGNVSSNVSRLGFKGTEGLSDNLSVIWQLEQLINIDNAGGTFVTRNSFVGLKSEGAGSVLLGRHDTPYKLSTRKLDIFSDSLADNRALLGASSLKSASVAFDGRQPDIILYTTPASAFTAQIAYANLTENNTTAAAAKSSMLSLSAAYDAAPFYGALGYEDHKLDTARMGAKESAWKAGLSYTMSAFTLNLIYERTTDNLGGSAAASTNAACAAKAAGSECFGHKAYYLSGNYKMGMNNLKFAYGKAGLLSGAANTGANQTSLGYDHGLSKRTKLYAVYSRINNESASNYGFTQTSAAANTVNGIGASPSVVSLGIQHIF